MTDEQDGGPVHGGYLDGVRVLELADETGEYAGKLLAGLGADVVKLERPEGNATRKIGPFYGGVPHPDRSLYFWHYNFGKRGLTIDPASERERLLGLLAGSDVFLETTPRGYLDGLGVTYEAARQANPGLVWVRITPFGDTGPWSEYKGSDLVHLALGGVMMNCGYDPDPITGSYDTPPIAPQMWHAYHVTGQLTVMAVIGALFYRHATGKGQALSTAVHEAIAKNSELDHPHWVYTREPFLRQTCRHASAAYTLRSIAQTKDGRYVMPRMDARTRNVFDGVLSLLRKYEEEDDLNDEKYQDAEYRARPEVSGHVTDLAHRLIGKCRLEQVPWEEAQALNLLWAPLRRPEENLADPHWAARNTFFDVEHPELGKSFRYTGAPWVDNAVPWRRGPRAPLLAEDVREETGDARASAGPLTSSPRGCDSAIAASARGKPFAINNVRVLDFTWWLASGGGPRFLASQGAQVIKVEWQGRWDLRFSAPAPDGGRAARDAATSPIPPAIPPTAANGRVNEAGQFNDINAGKRGISLNMRHPKGKELLRRLISVCDIVAEGFSPDVMRRWGFPYEVMREINPTIIYVQQSGMGQQGTYGKFRAVGPIAQALSGISEMSGLPEPHMPAGIGYSFLDWFGAYNIGTSMLAALYRREQTGLGTYIDASQVEVGLMLSGTSILNHSANGASWRRYGNRSPWKPAAPAGAYRCAGDDRWIAISCHTQEEWEAAARALGHPEWNEDARFGTLEARLTNQDALDALVNEATASRDRYALMEALQAAGVPAGVCQNAEDRYEADPQLKHLNWLTEVEQTTIGRWPLKEFPVKFSETPPYMGGRLDRGGPNYAEDNDFVFRDVLGLAAEEIEELRGAEII